MSKRTRIRAYGSCLALVLIGAVCGVFVPGLTGDVILIGLEMLGLGGILLLLFLEVGLSEDRDRASGRG